MGRSDRRLAAGIFALFLAAGCGQGDDARLLIVTTNDVSGKTSPCGCHTPKGGLARRAAFLDSVRAIRRNVLVVDAGGFFPLTDDERDAGPFMLGAMAALGTQAAGVGQNELRYGYAFVREHAREAGVPLVCANLVRSGDGEPAFEPWRVLEVAGVKVGVFGLVSQTVALGPSRDSLRVEGPEAAAVRAVRALRDRGAGVVVLLSQLGKRAGDSLVANVDGIDLLVGGGGVPALEKGVRAGVGVAVHGGQQGWQVGVADVSLGVPGGQRTLRRIEARTVVLGPEVRTQPAMAGIVRAFEDSLDARLQARAAGVSSPGPRPGGLADRYVGMATCIKCHPGEYAQWRTTAHARAWDTLVDRQKAAMPVCVSCHATGLGEPGGFSDVAVAVRHANVQCEACHGMGTRHQAWIASGDTVAESTCRRCHTSETSPKFALASYRPHVLHDPPRGLEPLPQTPANHQMRAGGSTHGH